MCVVNAKAVVGLPLLLICWLQVTVESTQTDGTLIPGTNGMSVVVAVLEKIYASQVFEESQWFQEDGKKALLKRFLIIKAFADSMFGELPEGGGIWNVTEMQFNVTFNVTTNNQLNRRIQSLSRLQIDWLRVNYSNLSVPMYSGLAIMLYLDDQVLHPLSDRDWLIAESDLPEFWNHIQNVDNEEDGWLAVQNRFGILARENCSFKSDIVFVMDTSHSISQDELKEAKCMVHNFTNSLNRNSGYNRIGVILIRSITAVVHLSLEDGTLTDDSAQSILDRIDGIGYEPDHLTNTADGLCKLSQQPWRKDDLSVIKVAIILSDGNSNHPSRECRGDTLELAKFIHNNHSHILVLAVGIGDDIDNDELSQIASSSHLVTRLGKYTDLNIMDEAFGYEICYTLSPTMGQDTTSQGSVNAGQIVRWTIGGVGGDGVTIRFCITSGGLKVYVSYLPSPSEVIYDNHATLTINSTLNTRNCVTFFQPPTDEPTRKRRQDPQASSTMIYIAIIGEANNTVFSVSSEGGNKTIDVNECHLNPHPCNTSANCHNTDGSFYCECLEGFYGDGYSCKGNHIDDNQLAVILPSVILSVIILILLIILIALIFLRSYKRTREERTLTLYSNRPKIAPKICMSEIQSVRAKLRRVNELVSATNPLPLDISEQVLEGTDSHAY